MGLIGSDRQAAEGKLGGLFKSYQHTANGYRSTGPRKDMATIKTKPTCTQPRSQDPKRRERAQGMVEFALTLPLLLVLILGIIEVGRLLFLVSAVTSAAREAARYGAAGGGLDGIGNQYQDCAGIRSAAKRLGTLVGINDGNVWIKYDRGIDHDYLAESCPPAGKVGLGNRIEVTVTSSYQPFSGLLNLPSFSLQSTSRRTIVVNVQIK